MVCIRYAAALFLSLVATQPASSNTYRWVDGRGRVHYSDTPSPSVVEQDVLDRQGRVLRKIRPQGVSPEAKAGSSERARERMDRALLSTYVDEAEIDLARERALAQERARQDSLSALQEQARARKARLEREAAAHRQAGRAPPPVLSQSLAEIDRELARLGQLYARSASAMQEITNRYAGYKQRFREIKGLPADTTASVTPPAGNGRQ